MGMAVLRGLCLTAVLAGSELGAVEGEEEFEIPTALWDQTVNLRGALGYKDNLLLSRNNRESSAFWLSELEYSVFRYPLEGGPTVTFFASGEDRRYFSSQEVEKEQLVLAQLRLEQEFMPETSGGMTLQYFYVDQVLDASATENIFSSIAVRAHRVTGAPFVSRELPDGSKLEFKFQVDRQFYKQPLDDYWEGGPGLTWTKPFSKRTELAWSYSYLQRYYDTRRQVSLELTSIPDTSLRFQQHELETSLSHHWDTAKHWRSRLRLGFENNQDNGSGFYDYNRYRLSKRFGYHADQWLAYLEGKILYYNYDRQVLTAGGDRRKSWQYLAVARGEYKMREKVRLFAEAEHEWVDSSYRFEEYGVNTFMGGIDWQF